MHKTLFTTERGHRHQQAALAAAPAVLDIAMLRQPDKPALMAALADVEYLISERVGVVDADVIAAAPRLKLILRLGSLTFDIDTDAAKAAGVAVCRWPVGSVIRVAEHMVLQMLALSKKTAPDRGHRPGRRPGMGRQQPHRRRHVRLQLVGERPCGGALG